MTTDIEIARQVKLRPIPEIAERLGVKSDQLEMYGKYKAKLPLDLIDLERTKRSKLILVSAISPTPPGEGKTTMSVGLTQGMNRIGCATTVVLREPSLGPVFGIKGGATGGGWSQVLPMEDINLHFTGDFAAVEKAHNLLAALIDNSIQSRKRSLGIDSRTVAWKRVFDMNDRALRNVIVGLGGTAGGVPRETGFDITAASEIMAILCLSNDLADLKRRLGNIFVGYTRDKKPVFARELNAAGAMTLLMKDAIKPNLVQTIEGTPAIIHGGPFANIAQGTNTIIATRMGLSLSDYVVTEAGFGFDLGAEKFLDIKCQAAGLSPSAVVIVATLRALKFHGGAALKSVSEPNSAALAAGFANLDKHLENAAQFNIKPVVAINRFTTDTDEEIQMLTEHCRQLGVDAVEANVWAEGGKGAENLARTVRSVADQCTTKFQPLYDWNWPVQQKIETICKKIYGAATVEYQQQAKNDLKTIGNLGLENSAVCIAKTQKSLSDDPNIIGRPRDFTVTVRQIEIAAGAGFVVPITGDMMRMPGLPDEPAAEKMDIDNDGNIVGLS
ncbi:MAG TPA: formate--tetrahydrofolate ligase [Pirellulaceae bacterium]|mgnify:CR=1 FL=1|nr:formate--tetrahydrofolate ligase [Pirellulaceae bacterium]HMO92057.1 formate--tetrahydrofolate ligase [Pirellulaceae bacterium]HMP69933.1 formate--tetrahydrofolate ligase [Pirellulaceae bacterium]